MKFVELRPAPDRVALELHRRLTWLRGLDPAARVAVVGLAHQVALGETPEWDGLVDVDGETMSLAETIQRFGESGASALIVDAGSLPSLPTPRQSDDADETTEETEARLAAATRRLHELDGRIDDLAAELAAGSGVRSNMKAHLVSLKAQIDVDAGLRLDRADSDLGWASRRASLPSPWSGTGHVAGRIDELHASMASLDEELSALPAGDRYALAAAIATARATIGTGPVPDPEAAALAQAWSSLHQRLAGIESRIEAAGGGTEAGAARVEAARVALQEIEPTVVPRRIPEDEAARLEVLHEAMIDAEERTGRGIRRGAARAAFDEAEAALQAHLAPLGYPTWAAFRMGNGLASVPEEALHAHQEALRELAEAESEWAELLGRLENDIELQEVLAAIEQAREHAAKLLGGAPDPIDPDVDTDGPQVVTAALRTLTVDAASVGVTRDAAFAHLCDLMSAAGASGHEHVASHAAVVALGESWLDVLSAADDAAVRILRDRERAEKELAALEADPSPGEPGTGADPLSTERAIVREGEDAVARCRDALVEMVRARIQLHLLAATELTLAEEHDDCLVHHESAQVFVELAQETLDGTASADASQALADRVPRGSAGPVPVVVVMGGAPADTLDRLAVFPDDVQLLVIGETDGFDEWLERVGPDVAAVVEVGTLV